MNKKVAIIGTGITGNSVAWHLNKTGFDITVFEKNNRIGGHSNTVQTKNGIDVDTGFIVYNDWTYPNLIALFKHLNVEVAPSDMSFAVSLDQGKLEYAGDNLKTLFAQKKNLFSLGFHRMWLGILRFYKQAPKDLKEGKAEGSLIDYLRANNYSNSFIYDHIIPMGAAIWSTPSSEMEKFPAKTFIQFCLNHGLLLLDNRPQWRTVSGGSKNYVEKLTSDFKDKIKLSAQIKSIAQEDDQWVVEEKNGTRSSFDHVVFACHGDEILPLLKNPNALQTDILSGFEYSQNIAYLHTDKTLLPKNKSIWASWNYMGEKEEGKTKSVYVTYWMNKLQPLQTTKDVFVSLNPFIPPQTDLTEAQISYAHPLFSQQALTSQSRLKEIQGVDNLWYCGAWCGYGFHEDGISAGLSVAESISGKLRPWSITDKSPAGLNCLPIRKIS